MEEWGFLNHRPRAAVLGRARTESSSPRTQETAERDKLLNGLRLNSQSVPLTSSNVAQAPKGLPGSICHLQTSVGTGSQSPQLEAGWLESPLGHLLYDLQQITSSLQISGASSLK